MARALVPLALVVSSQELTSSFLVHVVRSMTHANSALVSFPSVMDMPHAHVMQTETGLAFQASPQISVHLCLSGAQCRVYSRNRDRDRDCREG